MNDELHELQVEELAASGVIVEHPDLPVSEPGSILEAELPPVVEPAPVAAAPEPENAPESTPNEVWHAEAAEIVALHQRGDAVSPSRVVACVSRAIGFVPR